MRDVFRFHAELVLRHLRASSLPMRLWGWEQTEELIALAYKHRWHAKAYLVRKRRLLGWWGEGGREGGRGSLAFFTYVICMT